MTAQKLSVCVCVLTTVEQTMTAIRGHL